MALIGEWGFHDGTGTTAADSSGNSRPLTLAAPTLWATRGSRTGILPYASGLLGPAASLTTWSLMAWVYVDTAATAWGGIVGDAAQTFWLEVGSGNAWDFSFPAGTANASTALPTGTWAHLAVTASGSATTIYLNGSNVGGYAASSAFAFGSGTWYAGQTGDGSVFPGVVSELRLFDTALSAADVTTWMGTAVASGTKVTAERSTSWNTASSWQPNLALTPVRELRASDLDAPPLGDLALLELFGSGLTSVTSTRATTWAVSQSTTPVTATRATTWQTRQQATATRATSWAVTGPTYPYLTSVAADGRTFTDQNGAAWLGVSDAAWGLITHVAATDVGGSAHDMGFYFRTRQSQGFNSAIVQLLSGTVNNGASDTTWATDDGLTPFTDTTDTTPSAAYWARVDTMLDLAASYGMTLVVYPIDTFGSAQTFAGLSGGGTTQATNYGQFLGDRYRSRPNIVWSVGGDYDTRTDGLDAVQQAVLEGIRAAGDTHLRSISLRGFPQSNSFDYSTWATTTAPVDWSQTYTYNPTYDSTLKAWSHTYPASPVARPAWFYEGNYEGENNQGFAGGASDSATIRRSICWTLTSGGAGISYGSAHVWQLWTGANGTWYERILSTGDWGSPGVAQVAPLTTWWRGLPGWTKLVPDTTSALVTAGRGTYIDGGTALSTGISATDPRTNNYVTAARTPDGSLAVIYIPDATVAITVATGQMGATSQSATWVDPSTGTATSGTWGSSYSHPAANSAGGTDWLLVLQAAPMLATVTSTRPTTWSVAAQTTATRTTTWTVRTSTLSTRTTTWSALTIVTATRGTAWTTLTSATATRTSPWSVSATTSSTRATTWATRQAVTYTRSSTWATLASASAVRDTTWTVRSAALSARATTWGTLATAVSARATSWAVAGTLATVTTTRATGWQIRALATGTRATTWTTRATITDTTTTSWTVRTATTTSRATGWATLTVATGTRATAWDMSARIGATRPTTWDTLAALEWDRATLWDTLATIDAARDTLWAVLHVDLLITRSARIKPVPAQTRAATVPARGRVRIVPAQQRIAVIMED